VLNARIVALSTAVLAVTLAYQMPPPGIANLAQEAGTLPVMVDEQSGDTIDAVPPFTSSVAASFAEADLRPKVAVHVVLTSKLRAAPGAPIEKYCTSPLAN
jgi:hypothetical protein